MFTAPLPSNISLLLRCDQIENTYIIVDVFILGDCPAMNRNIRYNNGLPIVVMQ
jgi:hypothetical protein